MKKNKFIISYCKLPISTSSVLNFQLDRNVFSIDSDTFTKNPPYQTFSIDIDEFKKLISQLEALRDLKDE